MTSTEVIISPAAKREIKKLTKERQKQTLKLLRALEDGSETLVIEKIKGHPSFFRGKSVSASGLPAVRTR